MGVVVPAQGLAQSYLISDAHMANRGVFAVRLYYLNMKAYCTHCKQSIEMKTAPGGEFYSTKGAVRSKSTA